MKCSMCKRECAAKSIAVGTGVAQTHKVVSSCCEADIIYEDAFQNSNHPIGKYSQEEDTLRDKMARAALQGLLANSNKDGEIYTYTKMSYRIADSMMEVRKDERN